MQLSEFSLTTAQMEAGEVFKALETVISEERIQQAIEATQSQAERQRRKPDPIGSGPGDWHEFVVTRVNCRRAQESGRRLEQPMDSIGAMVANSEQISN